MKNKMAHLIKIVLLFILAFTFITNTTNAEIVCNKFKLLAKLTGSSLHLSLDTDLPENTVVMVSVSRSYLEKGNTARYSVDYFSEKSTVGKWKHKNSISIDNEKWKSDLKKEQEKMSRLGLGFDVASISEKININMVVPINQPDHRFGERNSNLTGKAVKGTVNHVVTDEVEITYPMDTSSVGKSSFPSLYPLKLEVGQTYVVTKQTPLMPSHSPTDPIAELQKMKQLPQGGGFKVIDTFDKKGNPWYRVNAFNKEKKPIGTGWINSTALFGQQLETYK